MKLEKVIKKLKEFKPLYEKEGFSFVGIFGSLAKGKNDLYSDIDIVYELDHERFSLKYKDGFSKLLRIEEIKELLEKNFHQKVDLISLNSNNGDFIKSIKEDLIYV